MHTLQNDPIDSLIEVLKTLDFKNLAFSYAEDNEWFFNAFLEESKVIVIYNIENNDIDYAYANSKDVAYSLTSLHALKRKEPQLVELFFKAINPTENSLINSFSLEDINSLQKPDPFDEERITLIDFNNFSHTSKELNEEAISLLDFNIDEEATPLLDFDINEEATPLLDFDINEEAISLLDFDINEEAISLLDVDINEEAIQLLDFNIGEESITLLDFNIDEESITLLDFINTNEEDTRLNLSNCSNSVETLPKAFVIRSNRKGNKTINTFKNENISDLKLIRAEPELNLQ